ncbi:MAG: helix-turn-helix domain-containing protein [Lachnospiraceae bacterium]
MEQRESSFSFSDPRIQREHEEIQNRFSKIVFNRTEAEHFHNSYERERQLLDCIRNGDQEGLNRCWQESDPAEHADSYGTLAAANKAKSFHNLCVVAVSLASRAAIEGGVAPEIAFSLCDSYIQRIEEIRDYRYIQGIIWCAESDFAELVAREKGETGGADTAAGFYVTRCKDYINAHLHGKITVREIAAHLHVNANYLSGLFHQEEGCTILQYIQKCKVERIKNMLAYSEYTYDQIAAYLGYSSPSSMNAHFKKITGQTLHEYRRSRYSVRHEFTSK